MVDIIDPKWTEQDISNTSAAPDGVQGGYAPSTIAPILRGTRGALKRFYVQSNAIYTSTGSANGYVLTYSGAPTAYSKGIRYAFWANHTNTGAATLNINGLGARSILQHDGTALLADQIVNGRTVAVEYDGTNFRLTGTTQSNPSFSGTIRAADLILTGGVTGNGSGLTALNASNISTGTIADVRLPSSMTGKTFTGTTTVTAGAAASAVDYIQMKPTDYGAGKPLLFLKSEATANAWGIGLWDGAGTNGTLNISASTINLAGNIQATTATFTGNQIEIQGSSPRIKLSDTTAGADDFWLYTDQDFYILTDRADDGTWEAPHPLQLRNASNDGLLYGNAFWTTGNFDPNSKLNTSGGTISGALAVTSDIQTSGNIGVNGGQVVIRSNGNRHLYFGNASGVTRGLLYNETADNSLRMNLYNSAGTYVRGSQFRESDGRFYVDGFLETNGKVRVGSSEMYPDGNIYMSMYGDYLSNVLNSKVHVDGRAYPRRVGGGDINFHWSGQGGQPTWVWGGSDGTNMYVYNPSNFNVNYANGAGNADTVDGVHASGFWQNAQAAGSAGAGWVKFPNGLILQIGSSVVATNGGAGGTIYFPSAFPTAVNTVVGVCGDQNVPASTIKIVSPLAGNGFSFNSPGAASQAVRVNWIAWGY